jgi:photosystem II stability/assembly factor-like uncharacterized protein
MRIPALMLLCSLSFAADPALFDKLEWRLVGPFRGGRVAAVAGFSGDLATAYFGSVGGGVWKSDDAGNTWKPVFDQQKIASIGAIAVAPSDENTVYVGTGEADIRSQIGFGDGMYKSTDAGRTWKHIGLRDSRQIAKILVDPKDPNLVYVAALGHAYGPNAERGVFRSQDGGATWQKVLDRGPEVGAVDLAFEPGNPRVIYATVWNGRRPQWSQYGPVEGPDSGLWKTTDGGDHWSEISGHGLPTQAWRRSGVATGTGNRVYLLLDAEKAGGLYRSDDAGANWTHISSNPGIFSRGWYFSGITVNPKDPDDVWIPNVAVYHSVDGGRNFTINRGAPGGDDYRIIWMDTQDPRHMVLGSDQGTNVSLNGGKTWSSWYNQPTAQFYHVITDNQFPYWIYGSQQDSGTAAVPNRTNHGEIDARDWISVGGEESGYVAIDPKDPNIVYVGNTNGALNRFDKRTGEAQNITPWPMRGARGDISQEKYRYPWTSPLIFSPVDGALYWGSQYVMKTVDGGLHWQELSPDLTGKSDKIGIDGNANDPAAKIQQGFGVVYAIAPSRKEANTIWAGSDTGLIHLTRDGGKTWTDVTPKGLGPWSKVSQIDASHFDAGTAYASIDRHRVEDYRPYVYRTRDYGKTWSLIAGGLEEPAYMNCVREDPVRQGLLYGCSELGVVVSFDDGQSWQSLQLNLPPVSVRDLTVHGDDLVIATFGRSFWVLDNMTPLRQVDDKITSTFLYKPGHAIRLNPEAFSGTPYPVEEPKAKNPPDGAAIDYYLKPAAAGEVTLEFLDGKNQVIRKVSSSDRPAPGGRGAIADVWIVPPPRVTNNAGMNRYMWDLRYAVPEGAGGGRGGAHGPQVLPGNYTVRLTADGKTYTQTLSVAMDPRSVATPADLQKQLDFSLEVMASMQEAAAAIREARSKGGTAAALVGSAGGRGGAPATPGPSLSSAMNELNTALSVALSADRTPPAQAVQLFEQGKRDLAAQIAKLRAIN